MYFDGSSTFQGGRIGVVLKSLGEEHMFAYKLCFPYSNNEAKYEALFGGAEGCQKVEHKKVKGIW